MVIGNTDSQAGEVRRFTPDPSKSADLMVASLNEQNQDLEKQILSLRSELEKLRGSSASAEQYKYLLEKREAELVALRSSSSWRITAPIRALRYYVRTPTVYARAFARLVRKVARKVAEKINGPSAFAAELRKVYSAPCKRPASEVLQPSAILLAELSLPQCTKYRVEQKKREFEILGIPCQILDWGMTDNAREKLQLCTIAIWYRVPGYPATLSLIEEARRLNAITAWEVDDLNFDAEIYAGNRNVDLLEPDLRRQVLSGVPLYRRALQSCSVGIASTRAIARAMEGAGVQRTYVVENGIDEDTRNLAAEVRESNGAAIARSGVLIVYGSGSKAHDADFQCATAGLARLLSERPSANLLLIGDLTVTPDLLNFGHRVRRAPFTDYKTYLSVLATADIAIAPLVANDFNEGKSNIKFLEAAMVGVPCVCSPREAFRDLIVPGRDGLLAETNEQWFEMLARLVDDPEERRRMGSMALLSVTERYDIATIAKTQLSKFVNETTAKIVKPKLRMLFVNLYFNPQRFGGATIVCEEVARELALNPSNEVFVFTSWQDTEAAPYSIKRYEVGKVTVFAVKLPPLDTRELEFDHPAMRRVFDSIIDAARPDVVHLHAVQGLGANLCESCIEQNIPYVITLHDAWWICERQFMVNREGRFCNQTKLDWNICASCVSDFGFSIVRTRFLRRVMENATCLLAPSEYQRNLYISNGAPPGKIKVNKNGIRPPRNNSRAKYDGPLRFGYVGGIGAVKGSDLVNEAFQLLRDSEFELVIVDNTANIGIRSIETAPWRGLGKKLRIMPAYTQDTIDDFFSKIDILLFPSQCKESFGLVVREALARDVWVISTDSGGATEDIVEGQNGNIICLTGDPAPLRDAVAKLIRDPSIIRSFVNPHKAQLKTFSDQAHEIAMTLREAASASSSRGHSDMLA